MRRRTWIFVALAASPLLAGCPPDPATCGGFCGPGTTCINQKCVVAAPPTEETQPPEDTNEKKRRRGRRGRKNAPAEGQTEFTPVDDSHVPRYSDSRVQQIGPDGGSERLANRDVQRHMQALEGRFNKCIATAAQHAPEDLGSGQISFDINVEPNGKVTGVSVQAPGNLKVFGIVPCLRVAIHRSRFPTWDGPSMRVEYSFRVE